MYFKTSLPVKLQHPVEKIMIKGVPIMTSVEDRAFIEKTVPGDQSASFYMYAAPLAPSILPINNACAAIPICSSRK